MQTLLSLLRSLIISDSTSNCLRVVRFIRSLQAARPREDGSIIQPLECGATMTTHSSLTWKQSRTSVCDAVSRLKTTGLQSLILMNGTTLEVQVLRFLIGGVMSESIYPIVKTFTKKIRRGMAISPMISA